LISIKIVGKGMTDAGLAHLEELPRLTILALHDTLVTAERIGDVRRRKPLLNNVKLSKGARQPPWGAPEQIRGIGRVATTQHARGHYERQSLRANSCQ
jgi:hypothetical protein